VTPRILTTAVRDKIREQADRADHLLRLVPADGLQWRPSAAVPAFSLGMLLGHLMDCLAGVCAALYAARPGQLEHFQALRDLPVNEVMGADGARERLATYLAHMEEGFSLLTDEDLGRAIPTVFVAEGEPLLTLLLGNLEHLINHKFQLFQYLKLMGVKVGTADLYVLRGER
jgi:hypothetical protein